MYIRGQCCARCWSHFKSESCNKTNWIYGRWWNYSATVR